MTTKYRPRLDEIADHMKQLQECGIGTFVNLTSKERAFYKPLPTEDIKETICKVIDERWDEYRANFKVDDTKYLTKTQFNRLLAASPYTSTELADFELSARNE